MHFGFQEVGSEAKKAHDAALGAAMSAMQTRSKIVGQSRPATLKSLSLTIPKAPDKKLFN